MLEVANDKQKKQTFEAKVYQPLGNQPLELSAFKELPSEDAHRKVEEGKERSSPALLGAAEEVSPTGEQGGCDLVQCDATGALVQAPLATPPMRMAAATHTLKVRHCLGMLRLQHLTLHCCSCSR